MCVAPTPSHLVWVDCEMTGLNPERDELLEVAVVVTDKDLLPLDEGVNVVVSPSSEALGAMDNYVARMHRVSGLLDELSNGVPVSEAQAMVKEYITKHIKTGGIMSGNSIATDRLFITRYMPDVHAILHYRMIDVSSIKELAVRWAPEIYSGAPNKKGGHRAMADVLESIAELAYYREHFLTGTA